VFRGIHMRILKHTLLCGALTACAMGLATPAFAEACTGTAGATPYQTDPSFTACYQTDAINGGNAAAVAAYNFGFDQVGYAGADLTWAQLEPTKDFFSILNGDQLVFDEALVGQQFFAIHFGSSGGNGGEYNDTLFFQFNFANPTTSVDLSRMGFSNAIGVYSTGGGGTGGETGGVPEPSTWAMMLLGFGGMGVAMRRRRRSGSVLLQAA
jgi:hypothetical protein